MAFHVYPDPQTNLRSVAAGATSAFESIDELVGVDAGPFSLDTMFIRVAMLGTCTASGAPDPTVILRANTGDECEVPLLPRTVAVFDRPGRTGAQVANATMIAETNDVYRVEVYVFVPGSDWQIRIRNNDAGAAHDYVWVVADADAESRQPWIDVPPQQSLETLVGKAVPLAIQVANKGTGPLIVADTPGPIAGSRFEITAVPGEIQPNACGSVELTFHAPATPGQSTATYALTSNDTTALTGSLGTTHNRAVFLTATAREAIPSPHFDPPPNEFSPSLGLVGDFVTVRGRDFNVGQPQVLFGTTRANLVGAPTANQIVVQVPQFGFDRPDPFDPSLIVAVLSDRSGDTVSAPGVFGDSPPFVPEPVHLTVITDGGQAVSQGTFALAPEMQLLPRFNPPQLVPAPGQFSPMSGPVGSVVTIFGDHFDVPGLHVAIGGVGADIMTSAATEVVVFVPFAAVGDVQITVHTAGGVVVSDDTFEVTLGFDELFIPEPIEVEKPPVPIDPPPPDELEISDLGRVDATRALALDEREQDSEGRLRLAATPNQFAPRVGGARQAVILFGTGFDAPHLRVEFAGLPAVIDRVTAPGVPGSACQIITRVPAGLAGPVKITVTTDLGSATSDEPFIVL